MTVIWVRRDHAGLGHAVPLEDLQSGACGEFGVHGFGHWRRTRCEESNRRTRRGIESGIAKQTGVLRGHPHHDRGIGQVVDDGADVKFWQEDHLVTAQHGAVQRDEQAVHVEDRQCVQQNVFRTEAPDVVQRQRV